MALWNLVTHLEQIKHKSRVRRSDERGRQGMYVQSVANRGRGR